MTVMLIRQKNNRAQSTFEYVTLIMIILGALLLLQRIIARGIYGRWKSVGDQIGFGRLYDPDLTIECYRIRPGGPWYNGACLEEVCFGDCTVGDSGECASCLNTNCRAHELCQ